MIKGVSKQVMEVTNPENPYFEKIVFFVKPQYGDKDPGELEREARKLAEKAKKPPKVKHTKKEILRAVVRAGMCLCAGVALTFLINMLI